MKRSSLFLILFISTLSSQNLLAQDNMCAKQLDIVRNKRSGMLAEQLAIYKLNNALKKEDNSSLRVPLYPQLKKIIRKAHIYHQIEARKNGEALTGLEKVKIYTAFEALELLYSEFATRVGRAYNLYVLDKGDIPGLTEIINRHAEKQGLSSPDIILADDPLFATAAAAGLDDSYALVIVGRGLLEHMNDSEIEGVIAHELGHISKNHPRKIAAFNLFFLVLVLLVMLFLILFFGYKAGFVLDFISGFVLILIVGFAGFVQYAHKVIPYTEPYYRRACEREADLVAAQTSKDPQSMGNALKKLEAIEKYFEAEQPAKYQAVREYVGTLFNITKDTVHKPSCAYLDLINEINALEAQAVKNRAAQQAGHPPIAERIKFFENYSE